MYPLAAHLSPQDQLDVLQNKRNFALALIEQHPRVGLTRVELISLCCKYGRPIELSELNAILGHWYHAGRIKKHPSAPDTWIPIRTSWWRRIQRRGR